MKKAPLITTIISVAALLLIVGCKKKEETSGTSSSATVLKGQVKAELNLTTSGNENVPDGTRLTFLIDPNDLMNNPDTSKKYDSYRYSTTVFGGNYSINLPARNSGTLVKIVPDEFEYQMVLDNNGNTTRVVYSTPEKIVLIYAGTTEFQDINY